MKTYLIVALLLCPYFAFTQEYPKSTIVVTGYSQKTFYPKNFKISFFLQEDVKGENSKGVIKTLLDSIKQDFFENVKAYGLKESDFIVLKKSSSPTGYGRTSTSLYNIAYQLKNQRFDIAQKLVDDLRINGLKGIVAKPQYVTIQKTVVDSLYAAAIQDAHSTAISLASQVNKTIGEAVNMNNGYNAIRDFNTDYEQIDAYNLAKFEISMVDSKPFQVQVTITYELKSK